MNMRFCDDEDFDIYYVLKVKTQEGEKYFFSSRVLVSDIGLAKKFNTLRSVRRSIKLSKIQDYKIEKMKREMLVK